MTDTLIIKAIEDTIHLDSLMVRQITVNSNGNVFSTGDWIALGSLIATTLTFIFSQYLSRSSNHDAQKYNWFMDVIVSRNLDNIKQLFTNIKNKTIEKVSDLNGRANNGQIPVTEQAASIKELDKIYEAHDDIVVLVNAYDATLGREVEKTFTKLQSLYVQALGKVANFNEDDFKSNVDHVHQEIIEELYSKINKK